MDAGIVTTQAIHGVMGSTYLEQTFPTRTTKYTEQFYKLALSSRIVDSSSTSALCKFDIITGESLMTAPTRKEIDYRKIMPRMSTAKRVTVKGNVVFVGKAKPKFRTD